MHDTHTSHDHTEVEWQFDADDLSAVRRQLMARSARGGVSIGRFTTRTQNDTYFDTDDWRFYRAGYALRLRQVDQQREATLKALAGGAADERRRREVSEALEDGQSDAIDLLRQAPGPVGERVRAVAGTRQFHPLFGIHTRRQSAPLRLNGALVGEVALDETAAGADRRAGRLRRVEIEVEAAHSETLRPFVNQLRRACRLRPAAVSKFEAGLAACDARPPQPAKPEAPRAARASQRVAALAYATLRRRFADLLACEPGARLGDEAEPLHDMRVANRRLRATLRLFRRYLPSQAEHYRQELRWLATALGEARDLDVHIESLRAWMAEVDPPDRAGLQVIEALLLEQRAAARARMLSALDSQRYERFVSDFAAALADNAAPSDTARARVGRVLPGLIERRYRQVRRLGDRLDADSPPPAYHALRIACKRLRYALEPVAGLYGKPARALLKRLAAAQDLLGLYQDSQVATERLRNLSLSHALPAAATFALGEVAQRHADRGVEIRAQLPATYTALKGDVWKVLRRAMLVAGG
jgi:CHAD domain-containing protein